MANKILKGIDLVPTENIIAVDWPQNQHIPIEDLVRGLFQSVKYAALREAELKAEAQQGKFEVILVLGRKLPTNLKETRNLLGVNVVDGIVVPVQDH